MKKKNSKNPLFWATIILGSISLILFYTVAYVGDKFNDLTAALEEYSIYYDEETKELSGSGIDELKFDFNNDSYDYSSSSSYSYSSSSSSSTTLSSSSSSTSSSSKEAFEPTKYEAVDFNAWNHDDIEKGKQIRFSGKVLQIQSSDGDKILRIAVNDNYDQIVLALVSEDTYEKVIAEDDQITIYGLNAGLTTYETVLGAEKTIPSLLVSKYDVSY